MKFGEEIEIFFEGAFAKRSDYCLIGRNILNRLILNINGPNKSFELKE